MATRKVGGASSARARGRLVIVLLLFLAVTTVVIVRRTYGIRGARELHDLDAKRAALVAERLRLEGEVRDAGSRARLQPIAEQRLQMHVPSDSQVIILPATGHGTP